MYPLTAEKHSYESEKNSAEPETQTGIWLCSAELIAVDFYWTNGQKEHLAPHRSGSNVYNVNNSWKLYRTFNSHCYSDHLAQLRQGNEISE